MNKVEIELPFSGFYETHHSYNIDRALEDGFNYDYATGEEKEAPDFWCADYDYSAIRVEYCKAYVEAFAEKLELDLEFEQMTSPREYNFSTDRIFVKIPKQQIDKIRKEVESHDKWSETIKERFTSYDGFWSHYSNDSKHEDWTADVLDECQYQVVLEFWLNNIWVEGGDDNWYEQEAWLTYDLEMANWQSVQDAHNKIEEYLIEEEGFVRCETCSTVLDKEEGVVVNSYKYCKTCAHKGQLSLVEA